MCHIRLRKKRPLPAERLPVKPGGIKNLQDAGGPAASLRFESRALSLLNTSRDGVAGAVVAKASQADLSGRWSGTEQNELSKEGHMFRAPETSLCCHGHGCGIL